MKTVKLLMLLILVSLSGCVSNGFADKHLVKCPQYFQDSIGPVQAEPFSPLSLVLRGYVSPKETGCPIHIYGLASKFIVWHESFHSFESLAFIDRNDEWELFYYDFKIGRAHV